MPDMPKNSISDIITNSNTIVLCFDFGFKNIGVATGQFITGTANPLKTLTAKEGVPDWDLVQTLIKEWDAAALVVGIPYALENSESTIFDKAKQFSRRLEGRFHLPVFEMDEHLSTAMAKSEFFSDEEYNNSKNKGIDSFAAKLILESWFAKVGDEYANK